MTNKLGHFYFMQSGIPFASDIHTYGRSPWQTLKQIKKPYTGTKHFLNWGKLLASKKNSFYAEQRNKISRDLDAFEIPEWFESTSQFSEDVSKLMRSSDTKERAKQAKKTFISSLSFTKSSIQIVQIPYVKPLIDVTKYAGVLSKVNLPISLILSVNAAQQSYQKVKNCDSAKENRDEKRWLVFSFLKSLLGLTAVILSALILFLGFYFSPYVMLCISTILFISTVILDLHRELK